MRIPIALYFLLGGYFVVSAQLEGDQWVMGYGHGTGSDEFAVFSLDFRKEPPSYDIYIDMHQFITGTSSNVCDFSGVPILETNGMELVCMSDDNSFDTIAYGDYWNFNDVGTFAVGFIWQEGAIILPFPESDDQYSIIYHNASWHPKGTYIPDRIMWAQVMVRPHDRPATIFKDSVVSPADTWFYPALVPVRHANGRDWWITIFEFNTDNYFTFLLQPSGLELKLGGQVDTVTEAGLGQMAFSWQGNYFARIDGVLIGDPSTVNLFQFDRCNGVLTRIMSTSIPPGFWSGTAFSPNERYLYASNSTEIYQWDLKSDDIEGSRRLMDTFDGTWTFGPMRTGPDERIYVVPIDGNSTFAHTIDRPYLSADRQPPLRLFEFPRNNARALPNNPNYRLGPIDGSPCDTLGIDNLPVARWRWMVEDVIDLQHIAFTDLSFYEPTQWHWDFGDGSTSTEIHPEHRYDEAGLYHVCLTVSNEFATDSSCQWIEVDMTSATDDPASAAPSLRISPNPFSGTIRISLGEDHQVQWHHLRIHDMHGRIVLDQEVPVPSVIHLEHLAAGVYACALYADGALVGSAVVMKM